MTASRGIRVRRGTRQKWLAENQGKHFCRCGCDQPIPLRPEHFNVGVPRYVHGHNAKVAPPKAKLVRVGNGQGYMMQSVPGHPYASGKCHYVMEHRLVMERHLRQTDPASQWLKPLGGELYLRPEIHVHHVNGVRDDNRFENLRCLTAAEHQRIHHLGRRKTVVID